MQKSLHFLPSPRGLWGQGCFLRMGDSGCRLSSRSTHDGCKKKIKIPPCPSGVAWSPVPWMLQEAPTEVVLAGRSCRAVIKVSRPKKWHPGVSMKLSACMLTYPKTSGEPGMLSAGRRGWLEQKAHSTAVVTQEQKNADLHWNHSISAQRVPNPSPINRLSFFPVSLQHLPSSCHCRMERDTIKKDAGTFTFSQHFTLHVKKHPVRA